MDLAVVVDPDPESAGHVAAVLAARGLSSRVASTPLAAKGLLADEPADLLLVELGRDTSAGLELIERTRRDHPGVLCFAVAERPTVETVVEAMARGADGFLARPVDGTALADAIARPARCRPSREAAVAPMDEFVAGSGPMALALSRLSKVAPLDTTVLLTGESGTGKEVAAQFLHRSHPGRRNGPMVCVHCGAIPDSLLESELFGHVKGAFTGADRDRVGKFEQANGGTIFLDEISTMKPEGQLRLLRVLQERRVTRIGSSDSRPVDVRVVVASNQDLKAMVDAGTFRLDLYYRVSTFRVALPALRERKADLAPLLELFSKRCAKRFDAVPPKRFSTSAMRCLAAHDWPGNVRELESAVEYAYILSDGRELVLPGDLPPEIAGRESATDSLGSGIVVTEDGVSLRTAVSQLERELILQSLRLAGGNKARAAELLDLKRTTFLEKLSRLAEEGLLPSAQADWSSPPASTAGAA